MTPSQIISSIGLGFMVLVGSVKIVQSVVELGVGEWLEKVTARSTSGLADFAKTLARWFKKDGSVVLEGRLGRKITTLLGDNAAQFIKRLGFVFALFGIAASAYSLAEAIKSGNTPEIIFDSFNTIFATAEAVFIGLDMLSFSWAGPAGLAIAAVGVIIAVIQLIYNIVNPPKPPPDPVTQFINGPMKNAHLLKTA